MTTLDTHEIVENLQAAGMPKPQAEAVMRAIKSREDHAFAQLTTKEDLNGAIAPLATKVELARLESRLVMWLVGTAVALFGLLKLIP